MKKKRILSFILALTVLLNPVSNLFPMNVRAEEKEETDTTIVSEDGEILFGSSIEEEIISEQTITLGENTVTDSCGTTTSWTYDIDSKTLIISGEGDLISMTYLTDNWYNYVDSVETIVVENSITSVPAGIFEDCTSLKNLSIPLMEKIDGEGSWTLSSWLGENRSNIESLTLNSGTIIPEHFASYCPNLQEINLANTITTIGEYAFYDCENITSIVIPDSVISLGDNAFSSCELLSTVTLSNSLESIGAYAFYRCNALTNITLPASLKSIGNQAFASTSLTELTIPESVEQIDYSILNSVYTITSLTIPDTALSPSAESCRLSYWFFCTSGYNSDLPESLTSVTITGGSKIADNYFDNCNYLTEINLPDTLTEIGTSAFSYCSALAEVTIPNNVTDIGSSAFYNCHALKGIVLPDSVKSLGNSAFSGCELLSNVTLSNSLESIGSCAFYSCNALTNITLPASLKSIGSQAFASTSLTELTIPESVEQIDHSILNSVYTITSLTIPDTELSPSEEFCSLSKWFFSTNGYNSDLPESLTSVTITGGSKIADSYFYNCNYLTEINLPDTLTEIETRAFYGCTAIEKITIPDSVTKIGAYAFDSTAWYDLQKNGVVYAGNVAIGYKGDIPKNFKLTFADDTVGIADNAFESDDIISVAFPESLVHIGNAAFCCCDELTEVSFPASLESVGDSAFYWCHMDEIKLNKGLKSIGVQAFASNDITSVVIPDSVEYLGNEAFAGCSELSDVTIPDSITVVGDVPFNGTKWYENQKDGPVYIGKTFYGYKGTMPHNLKLEIRDGTTAIAKSALENCIDLYSIVLPESLESIGSNAFYGCDNLTSIDIPDNVSLIGEYAFASCKALKTVDLPAALDTIENSVFKGCESLESIVIPSNVTTIGESAFGNCISLLEITIPDSIENIYSDSFDYDISLTDDELLERHIIIANGSTTVNHAMMDVFDEQAFDITIPEGVTSIDEYAFQYYKNIDEITLPESLTEIGENAFYNSSIKTIKIPDSVVSIGSSAFSYCENLTNVILPSGIDKINIGVFSNCYGLTEFNIPKNITAIGESAFYNTGLTSITIPGNVKTIGERAFFNCGNLTKIELGNGVTEIGEEAFYGCKSVTDITIPDSIISLDSSAFACDYYEEDIKPIFLHISEGSVTVNSTMTYGLSDRVNSISFPESITSIGECSFDYFKQLTDVVIPDTVTKIDTGAFAYCEGLTSISLPAELKQIPENMLLL